MATPLTVSTPPAVTVALAVPPEHAAPPAPANEVYAIVGVVLVHFRPLPRVSTQPMPVNPAALLADVKVNTTVLVSLLPKLAAPKALVMAGPGIASVTGVTVPTPVPLELSAATGSAAVVGWFVLGALVNRQLLAPGQFAVPANK